MKLVLPGIHEVICIEEGMINSLVIENPGLLYEVVRDLKLQLEKQDGKAMLSVNNVPKEIYKHLDLILDVYELDLNSKTLLAKITDILAQRAVDESHFEKTMQVISMLHSYVDDLTWDLDCEVECADITPKQMLKAVDLSIVDDEQELSNRLFRYVELVWQFLGEKLFVFVNTRGFMKQESFERLAESLCEHNFQVLFIDNKEYPRCNLEKRLLVDIDLCEF